MQERVIKNPRHPRFSVVVDTREQRPYHFPMVPTERRTLKVGDYSVVGMETEVAVERKSLSDFAATALRGAERFERELAVLGGYWRAAVVIEANPADILDGKCRADIGAANPNSIVALATYIHVRHGVPVLWAGDRQTAVQIVENFLWFSLKRKIENEEEEKEMDEQR